MTSLRWNPSFKTNLKSANSGLKTEGFVLKGKVSGESFIRGCVLPYGVHDTIAIQRSEENHFLVLLSAEKKKSFDELCDGIYRHSLTL